MKIPIELVLIIKNKIKNLIEQNKTLKNKIKDLSKEKDDIKKEKDILKNKIKDLNKEKDDIKREKDILENKIEDLNKEKDDIKREKDILVNHIENLNKEKEELINSRGKYSLYPILPGERIITINFLNMVIQDVANFSLTCKNTDLFIREEERLYETFPQFKNKNTYFQVSTRGTKRFLTLDENGIQDNDVINMFVN